MPLSLKMRPFFKQKLSKYDHLDSKVCDPFLLLSEEDWRLCHYLPTKTMLWSQHVAPTSGAHPARVCFFHDFSLSLLILFFGLNTKNGVFGPKGVQKISSNKNIWWSLRLVTFCYYNTGTSWLHGHIVGGWKYSTNFPWILQFFGSNYKLDIFELWKIE